SNATSSAVNDGALGLMKAAVFFNHKDNRGAASRIVSRPLPFPHPSAPPQPPDFHALVGELGDYPMILRKLGLVLDFEAAVPAGFAPNPSAGIGVWLVLPAGSYGWGSACPVTEASFAKSDFRAWSSGEIDGGLLRLDLTRQTRPGDPSSTQAV